MIIIMNVPAWVERITRAMTRYEAKPGPDMLASERHKHTVRRLERAERTRTMTGDERRKLDRIREAEEVTAENVATVIRRRVARVVTKESDPFMYGLLNEAMEKGFAERSEPGDVA